MTLKQTGCFIFLFLFCWFSWSEDFYSCIDLEEIQVPTQNFLKSRHVTYYCNLIETCEIPSDQEKYSLYEKLIQSSNSLDQIDIIIRSIFENLPSPSSEELFEIKRKVLPNELSISQIKKIHDSKEFMIYKKATRTHPLVMRDDQVVSAEIQNLYGYDFRITSRQDPLDSFYALCVNRAPYSIIVNSISKKILVQIREILWKKRGDDARPQTWAEFKSSPSQPSLENHKEFSQDGRTLKSLLALDLKEKMDSYISQFCIDNPYPQYINTHRTVYHLITEFLDEYEKEIIFQSLNNQLKKENRKYLFGELFYDPKEATVHHHYID